MKKVHQNITNVNKEHGEHVKIYSKNIRLNTQQWLVRTREIRKQCTILTLKKDAEHYKGRALGGTRSKRVKTKKL